MHYRLLGSSGLRVSKLWLGAMTFGEDWGWGAPEATCARMVDLYLDAGGNVVDTSANYTNGASEEILGRVVAGRRKRVVLSTKYSYALRPDDPNGGGSHRRHLVEALEASLRRLQTDHVDLLWVHGRDELTPVEETMRALDDQVRLGKVLYVGVSSWPAWEISRANMLAELRDWSPFSALQTEYSLLERTPERDLIPMCESVGLSVVAWSPLGGGRLTGKYLDSSSGSGGRFAVLGDTRMDQRAESVVRETVAVAAEAEVTPSQVAIAWLLTRATPVMPIIGATSEQQLAENLAALDVALAPEHLERLGAASSIELGFPHDLLARDGVRRLLYGDLRHLIET